jgi:Flp pilus assembly protein TadG
MRACNKIKIMLRNDRGAILILFAFFLPILLGFIALAVDVGLRHAKQQTMQIAADNAAFNGAVSISALTNQISRGTVCANEVTATARTLGFVDGAGGVRVSQTGCSAGDYVTVTITNTSPIPFINAFFNVLYGAVPSTVAKIGAPSATAVARIADTNQACFLALGNQNGTNNLPQAVYMSGNTSVESENCGVADNSTNSCSLYASGSAQVDTSVIASGGICGNAKITTALDLKFARPTPDPFAHNSTLQAQMGSSYPSGKATKVSGTSPISLAPGHYDTLPGKVDLNLSAGTYYFDTVGNNAGTISGSEVTIIFPESVSFPNNAPTFDISPPSSDPSSPYYGVSLASLSSNSLNLYGGNRFSGSMYLPNATVSFYGNTKPSCLQIIANKILLTGNSYVKNDIESCRFFINNQVHKVTPQLIR